MAEPLPTLSLYDWIGSLPEGYHGEVIDGQLHVQPRTSGRHGLAASQICTDLLNPYGRGRGGPGGWLIVIEPEVHFVRDTDFVVPDLGGWRRSRMADVPDDQRFEVVPDWVCEILSPSTASRDREVKLPHYARHGVPHAWLIDPLVGRLETFALEGESYRLVARFDGDAPIRAEPFDAVEIEPPWLTPPAG